MGNRNQNDQNDTTAPNDENVVLSKGDYEKIIERIGVLEKAVAASAPAPAQAQTVPLTPTKFTPDKYTAPEWQNLVPVMLFSDNGKYKDDLFVSLNGRRHQIRRGVRVMVPEAVYEIITQSEAQDRSTMLMIENLLAQAAQRDKENV